MQADGVTEANSVPERSNANTQQYAEACVDTGQALDVPVLDMFTQLPDRNSSDWAHRWLSDGLHFSPSGQRRVFELVSQSISSHFADLRLAPAAIDCLGIHH